MTPVERLDWQNRATKIATYRELYGSGDDPQVIGPEPTGNGPEMRAAWHDAFAAITRTDCVDVRTLPDSSLMHMHDSYRALAPGLEREQRLARRPAITCASSEVGDTLGDSIICETALGVSVLKIHKKRSAA